MFYYENGLTYPVYLSDHIVLYIIYQYLLLILDENKSHYVYIKDFNRFMCNKQSIITKNCFRSSTKLC